MISGFKCDKCGQIKTLDDIDYMGHCAPDFCSCGQTRFIVICSECADPEEKAAVRMAQANGGVS